jgi:uncharacterized protein
LLSRHFMYRRIYQYSSVKAYNFHLRRYMKANFSPKLFENIDEYLAVSDTDVISSLNKAAKDPKLPGHADAKCVIFRQHRFRAIALPCSMTEKDLLEFKAKCKLKDTEIEWEFHSNNAPPDRLSFPVSRRHVVIQKARECSDLLAKIPSKKSNWVYISPDHDYDLVQFLETWTPAHV